MTLQEKIDVMTAFRDGAEIEIADKCGLLRKEYSPCSSPLWDWHRYSYRIKEAPKTVTIEKWLENNGDVCETQEGSKASKELHESNFMILIKTETMEIEG